MNVSQITTVLTKVYQISQDKNPQKAIGELLVVLLTAEIRNEERRRGNRISLRLCNHYHTNAAGQVESYEAVVEKWFYPTGQDPVLVEQLSVGELLLKDLNTLLSHSLAKGIMRQLLNSMFKEEEERAQAARIMEDPASALNQYFDLIPKALHDTNQAQRAYVYFTMEVAAEQKKKVLKTTIWKHDQYPRRMMEVDAANIFEELSTLGERLDQHRPALPEASPTPDEGEKKKHSPDAIEQKVEARIAQSVQKTFGHEIERLVCNAYKLRFDVVTSRRQEAKVTEARKVAAYLLRYHTNMKIPQISARLNRGRDQIYEYCHYVEDQLELDAKGIQADPLVQKVKAIKQALNLD